MIIFFKYFLRIINQNTKYVNSNQYSLDLETLEAQNRPYSEAARGDNAYQYTEIPCQHGIYPVSDLKRHPDCLKERAEILLRIATTRQNIRCLGINW